MPFNYNYGGYPIGGYYPPPVADQLAQLRGAQMPNAMNNVQPQPMQQQPAPQISTTPTVAMPQPAGSGLNWVQGEAGARGFITAPGTTAMLMDSDENVFYLKTTDLSGMPQPLRVFDYTERTNAPKLPVDGQNAPKVEYVAKEAFDTLNADFRALRADFEAVAAELAALKNAKAKKKEAVTDAE